jgi:leucyl-tRNA synthetase
MVLNDLGLLQYREPFTRLLTQGMVIKDGAKMSKSKGNIVDPDDSIDKYGADTVRLFMLFAAPPDKDLDWSDKGVEGCYRFVNRVWRIVQKYSNCYTTYNFDTIVLDSSLKNLRNEIHRTIKAVTHDIEDRMQFNTAIARMMELVNALYLADETIIQTDMGKMVVSELFDKLLPMLGPFIPHVAEELWELLGHKDFIVNASWPDYIEELTMKEEIELVFQINGKIRSKCNVAANITREEMEKAALEDDRIKEMIAGKTVKKVIVVPGKLVNIVI